MLLSAFWEYQTAPIKDVLFLSKHSCVSSIFLLTGKKLRFKSSIHTFLDVSLCYFSCLFFIPLLRSRGCLLLFSLTSAFPLSRPISTQNPCLLMCQTEMLFLYFRIKRKHLRRHAFFIFIFYFLSF